MRRALVLLVVLTLVLFTMSNCSKSPAGPNAAAPDMTAEIESVSQEIDELNINALGDDDPEAAADKLNRAIKKLDYLLRKADKVINQKGDEAVQGQYAEALAALEGAQTAAEAGELELGFEQVQAGIALVKEAFQTVTGKKLLNKKQFKKLKELRKVYGKTEKLLKKARKALKDVENDKAKKYYKRARVHLDAAKKALKQRKMTRAEFNIKEARQLGRKVIKLVTPEVPEP